MQKKFYNFTNIPTHYRALLWEKLLNSIFFEFHFFFSKNNKLNIKEINFKSEIFQKHKDRLHLIENYCVRNRILVWQKGVIKTCLTHNFHTAIFLGEVQIVSTWIAMLICRIRRIQIVYWTHGIYGNESFFKKKLRVLFYKTANKLLLYESRAKILLIKEGLKESNLKVIYNSLDYDIHKKLRLSNDVIERKDLSFFEDNERPYLIFTGRLTSVKKIDLLIKAVEKLNNMDLKVNLLLIGDGVEKLNLENLTVELNLQNSVHFYGACYDESYLAYFIFHASLCVSPGNVGLTAIHSLSFGTPVCTHSNLLNQMPEVEAVEEGVTGCYFDENNLDNLIEVIKNWLNKKIEREIIRKQCYKVVDDYYNPYNQCQIMKSLLK